MDVENAVESLLAGFPVVITVPVQWGDQDALGHVNNTVFFRWMESARVAYGDRIGLLDLLAAQQVGPILASTSCDYRWPVNFPDTIHVGIRTTRIGRTSLAHEHRIVSQEQQAVVAEGTSTTVVFDYGANRSHPVPEPVRRAIAALEGREIGL
jgi:acyl-CoA thioester hydrolase